MPAALPSQPIINVDVIKAMANRGSAIVLHAVLTQSLHVMRTTLGVFATIRVGSH